MRHMTGLTIAAGAAVLFAGCSVPSTPTYPTQQPDPLPSVSTARPTGTPTAEPTGASATPTPAEPPEQPVATRPAALLKVKVRGSLYPVQRTGDMATVNLFIESQNPDETFKIFGALSDNNPETSSKNEDAADGLRLIDPAARKAYLPATTADGSCMCTPDGQAVDFGDSSEWVTVVFAAPPATTTKVDVFVPRFGTFNNVPIR